MKTRFIRLLTAALALSTSTADAQTSVTQREVQFYSEAVLCYGKLFLPTGISDANKVAAVVLAPGARQTSASLDKYAADVAARGMIAMTFDYRGWGKSGGFLYFGEPVQWDDRLRFSQTTTKMRILRKRLLPQAQVIDIRNAITYLQGEAGVDRARIGVWGTDLSGGHAVTVAGSDARVKAIVAQIPMLDGKNTPRKAFAPTAEQQAAMIKLARTGAIPASSQSASAMNAEESKLAFAEYHPFWYLDQIPQTTAVRFIVTHDDVNAVAASKLLKGAVDVASFTDTRTLEGQASELAAEWFLKSL
jgi:uncharacterized protein